MFKKIIQLFVFLLLIDLINVACCRHLKDYPRNCSGNFVGAKFNLQPNANTILFTKDTTIVMPFNNLVLASLLDIQNFNCVKNTCSGFILNQAQACKPAIVNITNVADSLIDFNIVSLQNYNANFMSGSSINTMLTHNITALKTNKILNGALSNTQILNLYNSNRSSIQGFNYIRHNITLNQNPTNSGDTVQFAIAYTLSNSIVLRDTTCKIVVTY